MTGQAPRRLVVTREALLRVTLGTMLALSCVSFVEPSPYEIFFFVLVPVAAFAGIGFSRTSLALYFLIAAAVIAQLLSLLPYFDWHKNETGLSPATYTIYSAYMWSTAVLFAMIFARETRPRVALALKAYAFSCAFAGVWSLLSYFDVAGIGAREPIVGRVAGPFKDPNVLGSYCILGVLVFMQAAAFGRRWRLVSVVGMVLAGCGVFLSFSRGSWGAMLFSAILLIGSSWWTAEDRAMRRRIARGLAALAVVAVGMGVFAASNTTLRKTIQDRAQLEQSYDGGVTGRFGNQKRSIPLLMARPLGFGPLRFEGLFGLDPHNSYVGAFASGGWLGGFAFLAIVASTSLLALRLMFAASPYLRQAQVVGPAMIVLFLQAFQIDIDHWRFVWLTLGMVWGLESARVAHKVVQARARRREMRPPAPALTSA